MFKKTLSPSLLTTASNWKGGDFMGIEQDPSVKEALLQYRKQIEVMEWEGGIHIPEPNPAINPDQGRVLDSFEDPRFPKVGNHR